VDLILSVFLLLPTHIKPFVPQDLLDEVKPFFHAQALYITGILADKVFGDLIE